MLEKELRDLDRSDALPDGKTYRLRNPEQGSDTVKEDLLNELEHLLRRYCMYCMPTFELTLIV